MPIISFEGLDYVGKSRAIENLCDHFQSQGIRFESFREPGGTPDSETIRSIIKFPQEDLSKKASLLLFIASRAELFEKKIKPLLIEEEENLEPIFIIMDRFLDSTYAYQGFGLGFDLQILESLNAFAIGNVKPAVTFLLDCPIEIRKERALRHKERDHFDSQTERFQTKVINGYRKLMPLEPHRWCWIDSSGDDQAILNQILRGLDRRLTPRNTRGSV